MLPAIIRYETFRELKTMEQASNFSFLETSSSIY